jgi:hypothetical protein
VAVVPQNATPPWRPTTGFVPGRRNLKLNSIVIWLGKTGFFAHTQQSLSVVVPMISDPRVNTRQLALQLFECNSSSNVSRRNPSVDWGRTRTWPLAVALSRGFDSTDGARALTDADSL